MLRVNRKLIYLVLTMALGLCLRAAAAQQPPEVRPEAALTARATAFYQALLKGDLVTALGFVAPESKNDFMRAKHEGLLDARVTGAELAAGSDSGKVKVQQSIKPARFGQILDFQVEDTWKLIGGEWCLVLPSAKDIETPFGRITSGASGPASNAAGASNVDASKTQDGLDPAEIQRRAQERLKNADPEQYIKALQKAEKATTKPPPAKTTDQNDKKKPEDDKKKPDQSADPKPKQGN
jgi:hypothetical protein